MSVLWTFVTTVLATIFLVFLGFLMRFTLRLILKPKITIRHTIEPMEISMSNGASANEKVLTSFGDFSVWISSSETVHVDKITFKRLCRYQKNCLLFDFLLGVDAIQSRAWCPNANVDTLKNDPRGLEKPSEQEEETIKQAMFYTGEFSYRLTNKVIQKGVWISINAPFHLLKELYHAIQIRLDYHVVLSDRVKLLRFLNELLEKIYRIRDNTQFSDLKRVGVDFIGNEVKPSSNQLEKDKTQKPLDNVVIGTGYHGSPQIADAHEIISDLLKQINTFLSKHAPSEVMEFSVQEMLNELKRKIPAIENMGFTQPPNGKYRSLPKAGWDDLIPCLVIAGNFCRKFLNCANFAALNTYFVEYFALLPYLLKDSYSYLLVANHNPFADVVLNLKLRNKGYIPTLIKTIKTELVFMFKFRKAKRELRRRNNKLVKQYKEIRDKKN